MSIRHAEPAMGTVVSYLIETDDTASTTESASAAVSAVLAASIAELHRLAAILSTWEAESPVSRYRRGELPEAELPPEAAEVLAICGTVKEMTSGWFDPWAMPGGVDPTGLAKGYIIERSLAVLVGRANQDAPHPVRAALVNGGGDIATAGSVGGPGGSRVGIQHPWRREALACVVELPPGYAVATSGRYERGAHLVDPLASCERTRGWPPSTVASATVTGPSLTIADGLATALSVTREDPYALVEAANEAATDTRCAIAGQSGCYEAYLIHDDGTEEATAGFPRVLHTAGMG